MQPDEPVESALLRNAVVAEVTVMSTEVFPTSTAWRHLCRPRTAPPVPAPFVPRNTAEVGESRCG
jgi:hypothetical protein